MSPKCVLAFITKVDTCEWMLWRDCVNSDNFQIIEKAKEIGLSCWSMTIIHTPVSEILLQLQLQLALKCAFWPVHEVIFETVPTSEAQLFYYLNIFLNVSTLGQFVKLTAPGSQMRKMSLTFFKSFMLCKTILHWCNLSVSGSSHILFVVCNVRLLFRL